jgi:hypothetical protein
MPSPRACRWKVDLVAVLVPKSFVDLQPIVSFLFAGKEGNRKATGRRYSQARISVRRKSATDLGKAQRLKVEEESYRSWGVRIRDGFTCQSRRTSRGGRMGSEVVGDVDR